MRPDLGVFDKCPMDAPEFDRDTWQHWINKGSIVLDVLEDGLSIGKMLVFPDDVEVMLVAGVSTVPGRSSLYHIGMDALEKWALENGFKSICTSSIRPGLIKNAENRGFRIAEIILRKDLS